MTAARHASAFADHRPLDRDGPATDTASETGQHLPPSSGTPQAFLFQTLAVRKPDLDGGVYTYAKAAFGEFPGFVSAYRSLDHATGPQPPDGPRRPHRHLPPPRPQSGRPVHHSFDAVLAGAGIDTVKIPPRCGRIRSADYLRSE